MGFVDILKQKICRPLQGGYMRILDTPFTLLVLLTLIYTIFWKEKPEQFQIIGFFGVFLFNDGEWDLVVRKLYGNKVIAIPSAISGSSNTF